MNARVACSFVLAACGLAAGLQAQSTPNMNAIAERYVKLVLALGQHDANEVDAYYGPPEWKTAAEREKRSLEAIGADAERLIHDVEAAPGTGDDPMVTLRREYLRAQTAALRTRVRMLSGTKLTFDEESRALYDAVAPVHPESYFSGLLGDLDRRLPGEGTLSERLDAFRNGFIIPPEKLSRVFELALAECSARTTKHIPLPPGESFAIEYVTGKPWSAYNWYQGSYHSVIQVNTDLPIYVDRAIDLACHEGYPGHHVYNTLLEKSLMRDRGWVEVSVYALFSPQSLIAEGTANYGIEVAFPGNERVAFERDVLFPAAGLDPERASEYYDLLKIVDQVSYAGNEAARRYLNGEIDRAAATEWLTRYAMMSRAGAEKRTHFFDTYRSYVINYNLGKDLVKRYIESRSHGDTATRWNEFARLLSSPRLPSGLQPATAARGIGTPAGVVH